MKETFRATNPPPPFLYYQQYPPNPDPNLGAGADPSEIEMDVEEDQYTAAVEASQQKHKKVEDTDPLALVIPNPMAATLHTWFREINAGTDIQDTLKRCERPENCDALKVVKINDEIKAKMQRPDEIKDQRLKWKCQSAPKAAWPLSTMWAELKCLEFFLQQKQPVDEEITNAIFKLEKDKDPIDVTELIEKVELSLKVIEITSVQAMQKRHYDLQYKLARPAKQLAEFNHRFLDEMFGPKMKSDVANIVAMNRLTKKLTSPQKQQQTRYNPFLGKRGRGRGRGQFHSNQYQGYNNQQYGQSHYQNQPYNQYQGQQYNQNQNWGNPPHQHPQPRQQQNGNPSHSRGGQGAHSSPKK